MSLYKLSPSYRPFLGFLVQPIVGAFSDKYGQSETDENGFADDVVFVVQHLDSVAEDPTSLLEPSSQARSRHLNRN